MKRSEIIHKLDNYLKMYTNSNNQINYTDKTASNILEFIEAIGMLPSWSDRDRSCCCSSFRDCPGCNIKSYTPTWDEENV